MKILKIFAQSFIRFFALILPLSVSALLLESEKDWLYVLGALLFLICGALCCYIVFDFAHKLNRAYWIDTEDD